MATEKIIVHIAIHVSMAKVGILALNVLIAFTVFGNHFAKNVSVHTYAYTKNGRIIVWIVQDLAFAVMADINTLAFFAKKKKRKSQLSLKRVLLTLPNWRTNVCSAHSARNTRTL